VGCGAFMKTLADARALARTMVGIGRQAGRKMVALISDMNQPLGSTVGNALEVREAIATLHGGGPEDLREHCLVVAAHILQLAGQAHTLRQARARAQAALAGGDAWAKFRQLVQAQGGDVRAVDEPELLPRAALVEDVLAPRAGYLGAVNAEVIGLAAVDLGAGRAVKGDRIDHAVGLVIHRKVGERVARGDLLFTVHASDSQRLEAARTRVLAAHRFKRERTEPLPLFYGVFRG